MQTCYIDEINCLQYAKKQALGIICRTVLCRWAVLCSVFQS